MRLGTNGKPAPDLVDHAPLRFFLEDRRDPADESARGGAPAAERSRLAAARAALRQAEGAEWEERARLARCRVDGLAAAHAALLQLRETQTRAATAVVEELRRRALVLRHQIALAEEAMVAQRRVLERLRRELTEIGE